MYCFQFVCQSIPRRGRGAGGVPHLADGGDLHPANGVEGYPILPDGDTPIQLMWRGVPHPAYGGTPLLSDGGVPPSSLNRNSLADGVP